MLRLPHALPAALGACLSLCAVRPVAAADAPLPPPGRPGLPRDGAAAPAPAPGLAMPTDYRLAAGDEVEIEVVLPKAVEEATTNPFRQGRRFIVAPGGRISVPMVKDVLLHGRSLAEVQRDVEQRLRDARLVDDPEVFVRVTAYAPRHVYLVGAVFQKIEVSPFGRPNMLTVFAETGEAMKDVDVQSVTVVSAVRGQRRTVNFRSVLATAGATEDALLDAGDILVLERAVKVEPAVPVVYVVGEVARPNVYTLQEPGGSNRPVTVLQLFTRAGGGTQYADVKRVVIRRADGTVQTVNLKNIQLGQQADVPLRADDMVIVPD